MIRRVLIITIAFFALGLAVGLYVFMPARTAIFTTMEGHPDDE